MTDNIVHFPNPVADAFDEYAKKARDGEIIGAAIIVFDKDRDAEHHLAGKLTHYDLIGHLESLKHDVMGMQQE